MLEQVRRTVSGDRGRWRCTQSERTGSQWKDSVRVRNCPGAEMGRILNELFDLVLTDAGLNEKEMLLKIISSKKTS